MTTTSAPVGSRRDRQRAATEDEIKAVARGLLAEEGSSSVALRRIARDMGMTAPALYRYFSSLDDLLDALCCDLFAEASDAVDEAIAEVGGDEAARMHAATRSFRGWALAHPAEFTLMFRDRPAKEMAGEDPDDVNRFSTLFLSLFQALWQQRAFDEAALPSVPPAACRQLATFAQVHRIDLPEQALWVFASSWARLYGVICMEVFGQLSFMFDDVGPYFEAELEAVMTGLGVPYRPLDGAG